ncbi:MAG: hypothetical protein OXF98_06405 [Rhodospirillaceae bacterium]|nr:hypothetical protein [Rhodospirillaceae bacterium]
MARIAKHMPTAAAGWLVALAAPGAAAATLDPAPDTVRLNGRIVTGDARR